MKNEINYGKEHKLGFRCEENLVKEVISEVKRIHPYEEVVINIIELANSKFE